ncbi:MAG: phosphoserine phosphatase SerB [Alphaproteobacteria bacterium]|nr:MAG: phosphoserine phosphatase SerB [Alphaproteobacteria bacterium]
MTQSSVLTLVADHTARGDIRNGADSLQKALANAGIESRLDWLAEEIAVDALIEAPVEAAKAALDGMDAMLAPFDFCLQPQADRRKKLFLADMDSTIITVECIDELADFAGLRAEVSTITEKAMNGLLDFNDAFRERVAMLKGLRREVLEQVYRERVTLTPGAKELVRTMRAHGTYTALVSGGFTFFTGRVKEDVGFDMHMSNELLFEDDALTGVAAEPILNSSAKLKTLNRLLTEKSLPREASLAVGDGANDIPMIEAAGLGVAFHAKAKAAAAADAEIRHGDLTGLLYFQGYRADEIVRD